MVMTFCELEPGGEIHMKTAVTPAAGLSVYIPSALFVLTKLF